MPDLALVGVFKHGFGDRIQEFGHLGRHDNGRCQKLTAHRITRRAGAVSLWGSPAARQHQAENAPDADAIFEHVVIVVAHCPDEREADARLRISGDIAGLATQQDD